jgi:hypothetical protein
MLLTNPPFLASITENRWANDTDGFVLTAQPGRSQGRPPSALVVNGDTRRHVSALADVLVPDVRMRGDEAGQKFYAFRRGQIHDLDAALSKPIDPAGEVDGLTHHHLGDPELPHEPAAIPARRQRRDHHRVPVAAPPAAAPKRIGLAMK